MFFLTDHCLWKLFVDTCWRYLPINHPFSSLQPQPFGWWWRFLPNCRLWKSQPLTNADIFAGLNLVTWLSRYHQTVTWCTHTEDPLVHEQPSAVLIFWKFSKAQKNLDRINEQHRLWPATDRQTVANSVGTAWSIYLGSIVNLFSFYLESLGTFPPQFPATLSLSVRKRQLNFPSLSDSLITETFF